MSASIKTLAVLIILAGVVWVALYFLPPENIPADSGEENNINNEENAGGNMVGNDRDEHGCIGSAGYMWCAPKEKCLRVWEEACYENARQEIQYRLAERHEKSPKEVQVTVSKEDENHIVGSVKFGAGGAGEGGLVLAVKAGNMWEVVFEGNGSVNCEELLGAYAFPAGMLRPNICD